MREQGWKQDRENVRWGQFSGFEKCMGNGKIKQPYPNPRSKHDSNRGQFSFRFRLSQIRVRQNLQCRSLVISPFNRESRTRARHLLDGSWNERPRALLPAIGPHLTCLEALSQSSAAEVDLFVSKHILLYIGLDTL